MKNYILLLLFTAFWNCNAQQSNSTIKKDGLGISIHAPKGVHQYAFRIGEWDGVSKDLLALNKWKTNIAGKHRVYVASNGLTFIEEGLDSEGKIIHKITYDYITETDSWENNYIEIATGKKVTYSSKFKEGKIIETIKREGNVNHNDYTVVAPNVFIYTARRTYNNGFKIITHVGISTKKVN